ncbi:MAG: HEAT repeat domain-containing protein, partial [Solirubrobacterales bacterium]
MKARRLHILVLLLIATCLRAVCAQEVTPAAAEESVAITQIDAQLRLYKTALLENPTAKNRVDAASLLLASETPEARKILLEVLSQADNPNARAAVCEALGLTKTGQQPIKAKEDFIKPLIGVITSEQDPVTVKLAAEATLIFNYSQVQAELEKAAVDASLPVAARANVIYAMRRHPDKQAVIKLLGLMDSAEPQIVEAARDALKSVGIVVSSDPVVRRQTLLELQQRSTEAFLRERVIRQETRLRENDADRENVWKKYLADKTTLYNLQGADAAAKITFLATHLRERDTRIKLWALDRLEELRAGVGTSKAKFSELEPVLIPLISDPSRDVRLSTAKRLASLWELNVAKYLLD